MRRSCYHGTIYEQLGCLYSSRHKNIWQRRRAACARLTFGSFPAQANPHVVPILYFKSKINSTLADVMESEWKHRCNQLQSLLPDWFPSRLLTLVWFPASAILCFRPANPCALRL